jgi:UDP-N-acetylmuramoyl-L-alanine---L-glutamate ligase
VKFEGKIAIWGYGREGQTTRDFILSRNSKADITIVNDGPLSHAPAGGAVLTGSSGTAAISSGQFELVIKSPGISLYRPEIAAGKAQRTEFTSATNLWFSAHPDALTIGITGTKGKSTTASVLHYLFGLAGKRSKLLGNVGTPMLGQTPGDDVTVLELSSYQIADLNHFPKLALVTNLHPEHGPWHHGHDNYYRDKMRLVTVDPGVPVVLHAGDTRVANIIKGRPNITYFEAPDGFHVEGDAVFDGQNMLDIQNLALRGRHNLVNVAGAFAVLKLAGAFIQNHRWDFSGFTPLPHRLQELPLPNGILAVNDSISTIPETTRAALDVHAHMPFHLILGGVDRGQDFGALLAHLKTLKTLRGIYLPDGRHVDYPSTGEQLERAVKAAGLPLAGRFENFDAAVRAALNAAVSGDTILLSPGAPSQTEFADFEQRGQRFLELCRNNDKIQTLTESPSLSLS